MWFDIKDGDKHWGGRKIPGLIFDGNLYAVRHYLNKQNPKAILQPIKEESVISATPYNQSWLIDLSLIEASIINALKEGKLEATIKLPIRFDMEFKEKIFP